jgi:hypothetical protein
VQRVVFDPTVSGGPVLCSVEPGPAKPEVCPPVQGAARPVGSCAHLVDPLKPGDELPDHICTAVMKRSVGNWQIDKHLGSTPPQLQWPLPAVPRAIVLVLRQRVLAEPNTWLEPVLRRRPDGAHHRGAAQGR